MERIALMAVPVFMAAGLLRLLLMPIRPVCRLLLHSGCGFVYLWLVNSLAPFTGIVLPVNPVTALTAGFLGLPGIAFLTLLEIM